MEKSILHKFKPLAGNKTIELRKSRPRAKSGDAILIYTTKPVMAVTAVAFVSRVITCTPSEMWESHQAKLGISKSDLFEYYGSNKTAVGIKLERVFKLDADILLSAIKLVDPTFNPPQTFKYLSKYATLGKFKAIKENAEQAT